MVAHEIGHALGFSSAVDRVPVELGKYVVESYDLSDLPVTEHNLTVVEAHELAPLDLARYTTLNNGEVVRSLNPNINGTTIKDVKFSQDGGATFQGTFENGKHLNEIDYLTGSGLNDYYYQGSHWSPDYNGGIMSPTYENLAQWDDFTWKDKRAFDVIGYDVDYNNNKANGTVSVFDWDDRDTIDVRNVLESRRSRLTSRSGSTQQSTTLTRNNRWAENEEFFTAEESYGNFMDDLYVDLDTF